ncbi:MAG: putative F420-dependent enzyme [Frankiales bacterium]|nr:putative F420-dependent enzyme [Frankiales bacterium]
MDLDQARAFLRDNHRSVLATSRSDGSPQMAPVLAAVDDQGRVVVSSREAAYKTKHLRKDPHAWLCAFPDGFYGDWVQVEGTVEVLSLPAAMEPLVEYYRAVNGEHPDWDEYRAGMIREERCLLRMTVDRAGPDRSG